MIMRLRFKQEGGHYHCRLFTAKAVDQTFAKCGSLVFSEEEWDQVRTQFLMSGMQVIEEGVEL